VNDFAGAEMGRTVLVAALLMACIVVGSWIWRETVGPIERADAIEMVGAGR
jgi:hypothetical protein